MEASGESAEAEAEAEVDPADAAARRRCARCPRAGPGGAGAGPGVINFALSESSSTGEDSDGVRQRHAMAPPGAGAEFALGPKPGRAGPPWRPAEDSEEAGRGCDSERRFSESDSDPADWAWDGFGELPDACGLSDGDSDGGVGGGGVPVGGGSSVTGGGEEEDGAGCGGAWGVLWD